METKNATEQVSQQERMNSNLRGKEMEKKVPVPLVI